MPRPFPNLIGQTFHRLTVVALTTHYNGDKVWLCSCVCGNTTKVYTCSLKDNTVKSCGCYRRAVIKGKPTRNLFTINHKRIYKTWHAMIDRCYNHCHKRFKDWGGRGITVCERWRNSPENFLTDMGYPPTEKHQIDRLNNELGYSKENCKWSTPREQANNRRNSNR